MYLVNVYLQDGSVITDVLRPTLEAAEEYVDKAGSGKVPYRKAVIYDNETKEAVRIFRA